MRGVNPAVIPRNHKVEEALAAANYGDLSFFERLLAALEAPYEDLPEFADYTVPPKPEERVLQTFCGTGAFRFKWLSDPRSPPPPPAGRSSPAAGSDAAALPVKGRARSAPHT